MMADDHTLRVLIVDDERTMQVLLSKLVQQCGCRVVARADNGKAGLQLFKEKLPDIVFLDINMPKMDGMELLENIREESSDVQICMVSADAYSDSVKKAITLGISGFIVKPLTISRVETVINKIRGELQARLSDG